MANTSVRDIYVNININEAPEHEETNSEINLCFTNTSNNVSDWHQSIFSISLHMMTMASTSKPRPNGYLLVLDEDTENCRKTALRQDTVMRLNITGWKLLRYYIWDMYRDSENKLQKRSEDIWGMQIRVHKVDY